MTLKEAIDRLEAMAVDKGQTWDLSPNDQQAIKLILAELARLQGELEKVREVCEKCA